MSGSCVYILTWEGGNCCVWPHLFLFLHLFLQSLPSHVPVSVVGPWSALRFFVECHLSMSPFNVTFQGHLSVPPPWLLVVFREALEGCAWPRECGEMRRWIFHPPSSNQSPRLGFLPSSPFVPHSLGVSFLALDLHIWSCPGAGAGLSHIPLMGSGMSQIP